MDLPTLDVDRGMNDLLKVGRRISSARTDEGTEKADACDVPEGRIVGL